MSTDEQKEAEAVQRVIQRARDLVRVPGNDDARRKLEWSLKDYDRIKIAPKSQD